MTMTDTEAKALVRNLMLIATNKALPINYRDYATGAAHYIEATEARHAAELRELKERFSEVAAKVDEVLASHGYRPDGGCRHALAPFILPAPDPLVEAFASLPVGFAGCVDGADALRAAMQARGYEWRKIGEAHHD